MSSSEVKKKPNLNILNYQRSSSKDFNCNYTRGSEITGASNQEQGY